MAMLEFTFLLSSEDCFLFEKERADPGLEADVAAGLDCFGLEIE